MSIGANFFEERSWQSISSLFFLKNLWKFVGSNWFQSVWWGDAGNCIVVAEGFLKNKGLLQIFETESMQMFICQPNVHAFSKMERDSLVSASSDKLQALAAAGCAFGKVNQFICT